jgi:hypothetical protein
MIFYTYFLEKDKMKEIRDKRDAKYTENQWKRDIRKRKKRRREPALPVTSRQPVSRTGWQFFLSSVLQTYRLSIRSCLQRRHLKWYLTFTSLAYCK